MLVKLSTLGRSMDVTYRQYDEEQEVDISNVVELKPQILGDEAERRVFRRSNFVSPKFGSRMTLRVLCIVWQGYVEKYTAPAVDVAFDVIRIFRFFLYTIQMCLA